MTTANPSSSPSGERLLTTGQVLERLGISRPTLWRRLGDPKSGFPQPVRLGAQRLAWLESEIDDFIDRLAAARDAAAS